MENLADQGRKTVTFASGVNALAIRSQSIYSLCLICMLQYSPIYTRLLLLHVVIGNKSLQRYSL